MLRAGAVGLTGFVVLVCGALPASAHVTVHSDDAVRGGYAQLAFRVPTESDTAATTKVQVALPTDHPVTFLAVRPHAGWTHQVTKVPLANPVVNEDGNKVTDTAGYVEWTASSAETAVKPGEYDEFLVELGPLPMSDEMVFKVVQTYDDGRVVRWIDEAETTTAEPEHPAAVLPIATTGDQHMAMMATTTPVVADSRAPTGAGWSLAASVAALVISAGTAVVVLRRGGRRRTTG
jgi:uncharacterized protein